MNIPYNHAKIEERVRIFLRIYVSRQRARVSRAAMFGTLYRAALAREARPPVEAARRRGHRPPVGRRRPSYELELFRQGLCQTEMEEIREGAALEAVCEIFGLAPAQLDQILKEARDSIGWDGEPENPLL